MIISGLSLSAFCSWFAASFLDFLNLLALEEFVGKSVVPGLFSAQLSFGPAAHTSFSPSLYRKKNHPAQSIRQTGPEKHLELDKTKNYLSGMSITFLISLSFINSQHFITHMALNFCVRQKIIKFYFNKQSMHKKFVAVTAMQYFFYFCISTKVVDTVLFLTCM